MSTDGKAAAAASRPAATAMRLRELAGPQLRYVVTTFAWSRAALWVGALFAFFTFTSGDPTAVHRDDPSLIHDAGDGIDIWARWDSVWFIRIAEHGYHRAGTAAFYPLYPWLVGALGRVLGGHYVVAGVILSGLASLAAFLLLERLATRLMDESAARRAVLFLAVFPMSLFLAAVYSESLFLALALGAFLAAEQRRFALAGVLTGLTLLTRPTGVAVLVGVALLAVREPRRVRALGAVALSLPFFLAYPLMLWQQTGSPTAFLHVERIWHRQTATLGPLGGLWEGLRAGWAGVLQLTIGSKDHAYWVPDYAAHFAAINLENLAFLVLFAWLTIVAWRRFGAAYGAMAALSILLPLSAPTRDVPLLSMPRFGLVVFPLFLALAAIVRSEHAVRAVTSASGVLLGVAVVQWALWQFVA